jgi:pyruvate/2-oxoacid:ferredoxin oxidoreductase beta subunit
MMTARAVPNATGMVEAGNDQGRTAMSHILGKDGTGVDVGGDVMSHVYHNGDTQLNTLNSKNGEK